MDDQRPLRVRRLEAGLTQAQLAAAVGCNPTTISVLERGTKSIGAALRERVEAFLAERAAR